ncbi:MAG TPA: thioredoxin family protein [Coriobacteriia bacterium]|nr:thioredoxin family protein [Coriobacteriia bacterium]
MKPVVDGLKKEYEGKVEFRLYNVETDPKGVELANAMGVNLVPTFVFVNSDGVQAGTQVGGASAEDLRAKLDSLK